MQNRLMARNVFRMVSVIPSMFFAVIAIAALAVPTGAWAVDYIVSPTGNDTNPGTSTKPWGTIQKAANSVGPGSTVRVMPGKYAEKVIVRVSGNATQGPIRFLGTNAILDFATSPIDSGDTGAFHIDGRSYVQITGSRSETTLRSVPQQSPSGFTFEAPRITSRSTEIEFITLRTTSMPEAMLMESPFTEPAERPPHRFTISTFRTMSFIH